MSKQTKPTTSSQQITHFKQKKVGIVVSTQMQSTVVVSVDSFVIHPIYKKKIRKTKRFLAHDPEDRARLGDEVLIEETKPISKLKKWIVADIKKATTESEREADQHEQGMDLNKEEGE